MKKNYFFMFLCLMASIGLHAQVWEAVGDPTGISGGGAGRLNLFTDTQNNLFVSYYDVTVTNASAQKFDGTSWSYLGEGPGFTSGTGTYNTFAVDNMGTAFFTNQKAWPAVGMEARKFQDDVWTQLPDVTDINVNWQASAIAPDNTFFIASGDNSGSVKRLSSDHEYWDQVGDTGFLLGAATFLDLVVGTNDKIYASFNNNGYVHVYQNDVNATASDQWYSVVEDDLAPAATGENYNSALAIDSNNNLYLAYVSNSAGGNKLNVKKYDGESWIQLGSENFTAGRVQHVSIAVNTDDKVYVAVSNWEDQNFLKNYVLTYDEGTDAWSQAGTGFASVGQATNNSLAIDPLGNLYLAFVDSALGKVSVKKCNMALTPAESIAITTAGNIPAEISTDNGTLQLLSTVTPAEANQNAVWSILSGEALATLDQNGLLTAITTNGVVTVKVSSAENASISNTIEITLTNQDSNLAASTLVLSTENNVYPDLLSIGASLQLLTAITPLEADQEVIWTVEDGQGVASVDANGLVTSLAPGTATIRATHIDTDTVYDEIAVNVWDNGCTQGNPDDITTIDFGYGITSDSGVMGAADFIVPAGTTFKADQIRMQISIDGTASDLVTSFNLSFLNNADGGIPDEEFLFVENIVPVSQTPIDSNLGFNHVYEVVLKLPEPLAFEEGTYWLNPQAVMPEGVQALWQLTTQATGAYYNRIDSNNGQTAWSATANYDAVFEITGYCIETLGVAGHDKASFNYFPNPVKDKLNFTTDGDIKNITVYNVLGQAIAANVSNSTTLDTSMLASGTYLVKAELESGQVETFKIIKQ